MKSSYDVVILVDAMPRGQTPGTVSLIEPLLDGLDAAPAGLRLPAGEAAPAASRYTKKAATSRDRIIFSEPEARS